MRPKRLRAAAPGLWLLLVLLLGFVGKPAVGVDLRDVALAGLASIPELDMNAMARGVGKITCV